MNEQEYRAYNAINYSKLSTLDKDPINVNREREISYSQIEGKALDTWMFDNENFKNLFFIMPDNAILEDKPLQVFEILYEKFKGEEPSSQAVIEAAREADYYSNYKDEVKLYNKVWDTIKFYYNTVKEAGTKTKITNDTYEWCIDAGLELKSNFLTAKYFESTHPNIIITFQKPLIWKQVYNGTDVEEFKGLLDIEIRNDVEKWVRLVDLKKVGKKTFESDYYFWKYYLQEGLYKEGLKHTYPDYKVLESVFITAFRNDPARPMAYYIREEQHQINCSGGLLTNGVSFKGVFQLVEDLLWHQNYDKWEYPKEVYELSGKYLNKLTNDIKNDK